MQRPAPTDAAVQVVRDRYPRAVVAILAGSVTSGTASPTSDLDLIVVDPRDPEVPYRESFSHLGWPVEAFLHDEESIEGFYRFDAASGECALAWMVSTGTVVVDEDGSALRLRQRAQAVIDEGPPPATDEELRDLRYTVTDLLDDLIGDPAGDESLFIAASLAAELGSLILALQGAWRAGGKWLLRRLRMADPEVADELVAALRAHEQGDATPLIILTERVLGSSGGRMFEGYRASGKPLLEGFRAPRGAGGT
jgi:predicted nucleotidyltransferase